MSALPHIPPQPKMPLQKGRAELPWHWNYRKEAHLWCSGKRIWKTHGQFFFLLFVIMVGIGAHACAREALTVIPLLSLKVIFPAFFLCSSSRFPLWACLSLF